MTGAHSTYAYREQQTKRLLKRLLADDSKRWRTQQRRVLSQPPSVATRFELSLIEDRLAEIAEARTWLETATLPRRIR